MKADARRQTARASTIGEGRSPAEGAPLATAPEGRDAAPAPAERQAAARAQGGRPYWQEPLAPYAQPRLLGSLLNLCTSVVPYLAISVAMWLGLARLRLPAGLVLLLCIPAAGFLMRTFIVFHDCFHGSFLPSRPALIPPVP